MMRAGGLAAALLGVALLGACAAKDFVKEGATEDQFRHDEALCRAQVNNMMARDRNIDTDRRTTVGSNDNQQRATGVREQMNAAGDRNRSGALMENCMRARGWTPQKKTSLF